MFICGLKTLNEAIEIGFGSMNPESTDTAKSASVAIAFLSTKGCFEYWSTDTIEATFQLPNRLQIMKRNRIIGKRFDFAKLEPRNMLAATVYVDFGDGFAANGGFTISDTESLSVGGPEIFGDSTSLTSLSEDYFADVGHNDEELFQALKDGVVDRVNYLFEPFDVAVQIVSANTIEEVATTLDSTATNDAYIYVGGSVPEGVTGDFGAAVPDAGNTDDNMGFVFSEFANLVSRGSENPLAAAIARQVGISFGIQTTEYSDPGSLRNVMSTIGTDANGDPTAERILHIANYEFVRFDLPRTFESGVAPGTSNSFDELQTLLGKNADGIEYFTGTFGQSNYELEEVGDNLVNFSLNGEQWNNVDISNGLILRNTEHAGNGLLLKGRAWDITATNEEITLDANIRIITNAQYNFVRGMEIQTEDFDDTVEIIGQSTHVFDLGGGNDTFTLPYVMRLLSKLDGGDGDDRFVYSNSELLITSSSNPPGIINAGAGFDTLDFSALEEAPVLPIWDVDEDGFTFGFVDRYIGERMLQTGFEQVIASEDYELSIVQGTSNCVASDKNGCTPPRVPIGDDNVVTTIDGDSVSIRDTELNKELVYSGPLTAIWSHEIYLLSTVRDLSLTADDIQISSSLDLAEGTTDTILHEVTALGRTVVGNMAGEAKQVRADGAEFSGLAEGKLILPNYATKPTILLSDTGDDRFTIVGGESTNFSFIEVFGNGGNDTFVVGSSLNESSGNLDVVLWGNTVTRLIGGEGDNYLYLNDEGVDDDRKFVYELKENSIRSWAQVGARISRNGAGIEHEDMAVVRIRGTRQNDVFRVEPSEQTVFYVEGTDPGAGDGDSLELIGEPARFQQHIVRAGQGSGTWYFGKQPGDSKIVLFDSVEHIAQSQILAVGSQSGVPSLVRVFNATTQEHLYDIRPYPARFLGGVQVETADFNGDSVPDVVVSPGAGRYALVQIYDGRNGNRIGHFHAFPGDNPDPSKNFRGGADIAIGNVRGDSGYEIIASTLTNSHYVRTFEQTSPMEFNQVHGFNVFPSANRAGVRVATGDVDADGYDDIVSTPGPGWIPQVAVHSLVGVPDGANRRQLSRFLGYVNNYKGGFNVAAGDYDLDGKADIFLGAVNSGSSADFFSGQVRIFSSKDLPQNAGSRVIDPNERIHAFSRNTKGVGIHLLDADRDGVLERMDFTVQRGGDADDRGRVQRRSPNAPFGVIDNIFANASLFGAGMEV